LAGRPAGAPIDFLTHCLSVSDFSFSLPASSGGTHTSVAAVRLPDGRSPRARCRCPSDALSFGKHTRVRTTGATLAASPLSCAGPGSVRIEVQRVYLTDARPRLFSDAARAFR